MRILAVVLVSAFILSVAPVTVLAGSGGCSYEQAYQPQLVKTQPAQNTGKEKSEKVVVAQKDATQEAVQTKGEKR